MRLSIPLALTLVVGVALGGMACGDDAARPSDAADADSASEASSDSEVASDADATAQDGDDGDSDDGDSTDDDALDTEVIAPPAPCADDEACNTALDALGRCPGRCFDTSGVLTCQGTVIHAACNLSSEPPPANAPVDFGRYTITPVKVPDDAQVGDVRDFEARLTNTSDALLTLDFFWKNPGSWQFADASWEGLTTLSLSPGESFAFTARITAERANTLRLGGDLVVTFQFDPDPNDLEGEADYYEPRATVHYPDTTASGGFACGGEFFPARLCANDDPDDCFSGGAFYQNARCCDGVFFVGATCCSDSDCNTGACADGKCVYDAPYLGSANTPAIGHQRIRIVLVDAHPELTDPCVDHSATLGPGLGLEQVEAWFDALAQRRLGRDAMDIEWTVTTVATSDFLTGPNPWFDYRLELDAYLTAAGCPLLDAYDKVIVASPTVDMMGAGGLYMDRGEIIAGSVANPYLTTHELAHSFGATDLYLDLGGRFLYPFALMGNFLFPEPLPGDAVTWAELGFGDVDRSGVIDVVEMAAFPDALDVADLTAVVTDKDTLEIRWRFVGLEDGVAGHVLVPVIDFVRVPVANYELTNWQYQSRWKPLVIGGSQIDLQALRAAGQVDIVIRAHYRFTDRSWTTRTLTLDRTFSVPISAPP